jgi:hypothetical protein
VPRALVCATADLMNSPVDGLPNPLVTEALLATQGSQLSGTATRGSMDAPICPRPRL